jgi:glycosyltransferase involved in cell wall biosynthesis
LKNRRLALFFTCGLSLKIWEDGGNLSREIKPYEELAKYLDKIYFFTYGDTHDRQYHRLLPQDIRIFSARVVLPSTVYSLLLPFFYREEIRGADILKTNQMSGAWTAVLAKWLYRRKLVIRCGYEWLFFSENQKRALWERKIIYFIEEIAYRAADKIILTSKEDKKFVEDRFKVSSSKIEVIPNYIDTELFRPLNIREETNGILFVGRLAEQKNLFNLIEAISGTALELVIIGSGSLKEELESFAKEKQVKLKLKGNIPNKKLPEELNKSEIFVLPSFYEGCPKTLLEAMACGLPCIGTNVEGIREIIKHRENGYLCAANSESIRKAICEVLEDKALREKIGQNARKTILENFSLDKVVEKEVEIYKSL